VASEIDLSHVKHLLELQLIYQDKVKQLREEACTYAAKARELDKILTPDVLKEYQEYQQVLDAYQIGKK
jgi:hypothetical protein